MKFIQIAIGPYDGATGRKHTVYGLSEKGNVFKYERNKGWVQLKDKKTLPKAFNLRFPSGFTSTVKPSQQLSVDDDDIPF